MTDGELVDALLAKLDAQAQEWRRIAADVANQGGAGADSFATALGKAANGAKRLRQWGLRKRREAKR